MKNITMKIVLGICFIFTVACSGEEARPEVIKKLRAFGVTINPFVTSGSVGTPTVATMTFHLASNSDSAITTEQIEDSNIFRGPKLDLTIVDGSEAFTNNGATKIYSVSATAILPPANLFTYPPESPFLSLSYGLEFSQGEEQETTVNKLVFYPEGAEELNWLATPPTISMTSLEDGQTVAKSELELKANIENKNGESYKVAWFVSSGKVKNRRAINTSWSEMDSGPQTIIVTARGNKTASFSWQTVDIIVE